MFALNSVWLQCVQAKSTVVRKPKIDLRSLKTGNRPIFWLLYDQASFHAFYVLTDRAPLPGVQLNIPCHKMSIFLAANRLKICHHFQNSTSKSKMHITSEEILTVDYEQLIFVPSWRQRGIQSKTFAVFFIASNLGSTTRYAIKICLTIKYIAYCTSHLIR